MAEESTCNVALLAIKPKYAERIMSKQKKVEFRKGRFKESVTTVVVYASSPVKRVIGWFSVRYVDEDKPQNLWSRHGHYGGISRKDFKDYFDSHEIGFAIGVSSVKRLVRPVKLAELSSSLTAPQSFVYISENIFSVLKNI